MERWIEAFILGTRWLLLPLYLALLLSVCGIYVMVGRELIHLVATLPEVTESDVILAILALLDLVLIANLLVMVAVSSYESYISRIDASGMLRAFMNESATDRLVVLAGVHLVFVASALLLAFVDKIGRSSGAH